jgi:hypothetical protein
MRLSSAAGCLALLLANSAGAALTPAEIVPDLHDPCALPVAAVDCNPGPADEALVAAELLYESMGVAAISFAFERAAQLAADNELAAAELWRRIAIAAAELAARRRSLDRGDDTPRARTP